jgi:hypothetical protein
MQKKEVKKKQPKKKNIPPKFILHEESDWDQDIYSESDERWDIDDEKW